MTKVAQGFLDLVKRSQLVEEDQLQAFLTKFRADHGAELPERQEAQAEAQEREAGAEAGGRPQRTADGQLAQRARPRRADRSVPGPSPRGR